MILDLQSRFGSIRGFSKVNSKQRKTLDAIYEIPVRSDIRWADIESLLKALGADLSEGRGSRRRIVLNGIPATFHRPHPKPVTDKGSVRSMRRFLEGAGVRPS